MNANLSDITLDDATKLLITWLRAPDHGTYPKYGYDIYLPSLIFYTRYITSYKI
jgi:hypothetical protein